MKFSLKIKLFLFSLAIVVVVLAAFSYSTYKREKSIVINNIVGKSLLLAQSFAQQVYDPITRFAIPLVHSYMDELKTQDKNILGIWVLDENGKCVASCNSKYENKKFEFSGMEFLDYPLTLANKKANSPAYKGKIIVKGHSEVEKIVVFESKYLLVAAKIVLKNEDRKIVDRRGLVVIKVSLSPFKKAITRMFKNNLWLFILFVIIAILATHWMSSFIIKPILAITDGAHRLSMGDFSTKIDLNSQDELGLLAKTFNEMTDNIYFLYDVTKATSFVNDSEEILKIVLEKVVLASHASRGSLLLLNDKTDELELKMVIGDITTADVKKKANLKVGEGAAGKVIETGESLILNSGSKDPLFKSFFPERESKIESLMIVALLVDDKAIGAINVVNKREGEFTERDVKLVEAMASTAAMAIKNSKLYEMAITDGMTKLYIHRYFQARLEDELVRARRYNNVLSLIMFDIDHFKNFNDTYGHQQGDVVIIETARILKSTLRQGIDVACRYGGEEFTVILPETDTDGAYLVAERLRKNIEQYDYPWKEGKTLKVTISLGVSTFPKHAQERKELIRMADEALYLSKEKGRNSTSTADELPQFSGKK
jgi:diguanylate cyclase (GGDEF)-like protein